MAELMPLLLFVSICLVLLAGYPVAFSLAGTSLLFAGIGIMTGTFDTAFLHAYPNRVFGNMSNTTLIAVPLFVLMGVMLEKSRIAEELLETMGIAFSRIPGGLGISVVIVGMLLAASTGIVGATVVTMGLIALPSMLRQGYAPSLAAGTICATGTLGQIIPPSIVLVLLGDILSSAYQQAQLAAGSFAPKIVSVGDLFIAALVPGFVLVLAYLGYLLAVAILRPDRAPAVPSQNQTVGTMRLLSGLLPPLLLMLTVLGSIIAGAATPTEAAGLGALCATVLAAGKGQLSRERLREVANATLEVTSMVFMILLGAAVFSLVFRGFGGDEQVAHLFDHLPGGTFGAVAVVMLVIFLLGFILDFIEITFVVVPIVAPVLFSMGVDPLWLGIMIAVNLQTSFLTPPFGFALFYLRGVAPASLPTAAIYRGALPYIVIQILLLASFAIWPDIITWLPSQMGNR